MDPFEIAGEVQISPDGVRRLRKGHLWVYSGEVMGDLESPRSALIRLQDTARNHLGFGLYSPKSKIRIRLFSREENPPDRRLFESRIADAVARRRRMNGNHTAGRLVFAEADLLPSIIVDRYSEYLVLQTLSGAAETFKQVLVEILQNLLKPRGIVERNDVKARLLEGLEECRGVIRGEVPEQVEIVEGEVTFLVDLLAGQKTGFFLDQGENRLAARRYASGRALDCFANTGAFALHFASRCVSVLAVESSRESLEQGRLNASRNGIENVEFQQANVFDFLKEADRRAERYDLVCLDPPAFAKNRASRQGAKAGYKEINLRALKVLKSGGILVTSSCSYHVREAEFFQIICEAAHDARRYVQVLERRSQASDHPFLASMPETHYLKCFILRAI